MRDESEGTSRCEHRKLVKKEHEIVCAECGLVTSEFGLSPEPRSYNQPGLWDYTSFTLGSDRLTSRERTELAVATRIDILSSNLALPGYVSAQAMVEARKILRAVRGRAGVRLTVVETVIAAIWSACKITRTPFSMKEYAKTLRAMGFDYDENRIFRLLNRASRVMNLPRKLIQPKEYIPKITAKLKGKVSIRYLSAVERYAMEIAESAEEELKGRNPVYSAAAAVCAADHVFGGRIGWLAIAEVVDSGAGLSDLASKLRERGPPPPSEVFDLVFVSVRAERAFLLAEA